MPRRNRDDDDRDDDFHDRPRPDRGGNPVLIVLVIAGGVLLLIVLGCAGHWFVGSRAANQAVQQAEADAKVEAGLLKGADGKVGDAKKVYTRDEWTKLVTGKTPAELIAVVGRPNSTTDNPDNTPRRWMYWNRVMNPATGKAGSAWLEFEDGKVVRIEW
jgi:hypothetical protein